MDPTLSRLTCMDAGDCAKTCTLHVATLHRYYAHEPYSISVSCKHRATEAARLPKSLALYHHMCRVEIQ